MSDEVAQAFATLRRHLPASLRPHEAALEAAWFNGGPLPVDLPDRFRGAAKVADRAGWIGIGADLQDLAFRIEVRHMPTDVVEAIVQALLGQEVDR